MQNKTICSPSAVATAASTVEFLAIATLARQYQNGEDLSETLTRLLGLQELKREQGISQREMQAVLRNPHVERLRRAVGSTVRTGRIAQETEATGEHDKSV